MTLLEMSLSGGVMILAVILLRALALNRLPKGTFLALWLLAAARLLLPVTIPSPVSVYALAGAAPAAPALSAGTAAGAAGTAAVLAPPAPPAAPAAPVSPVEGGFALVWIPEEILPWIWGAGVLACGGVFLLAWLRSRRRFAQALRLEDGWALAWLEARRPGRPVRLRVLEGISAPLTYGVLRPVILLPKSTDWADRESLEWILAHELAHIRHLDALWKLLLAAAACVHWFNPLAWVMLALANRDMELRCDEAVVRSLGLERRGDYALTLIGMEEKKSGLGPFASAFSRSGMEERITAIMKLKKRSLAALLAAVLLVCCVGMAFATSPEEKAASGETPESVQALRAQLTALPGGDFTEEESRRLFALWTEGYGEMTVADYRRTMRESRTEEDMELIERLSLWEGAWELPGGSEGEALEAFCAYFFRVYEPLTADQWRSCTFDGSAANGAQYVCSLTILDGEALSVGDYERTRNGVEALLRQAADEASAAAALEGWCTSSLHAALEAWRERPGDMDGDALLSAQFSRQLWAETLAPYIPLGLTYVFDDPDHDGNGLTMWYGGREVRGICDDGNNLWITEHSGLGWYAEDAVELYTVYTGGVLTGLRLATPEEQAAWDARRGESSGASIPMGQLHVRSQMEEQREFPRASEEDYDALLSLRTVERPELPAWASYPLPDARDLTLEDFNSRLLDWANANPDAWDRINCDVLWKDYGVELTPDERTFVSVTCLLSGTENGQMVRSLYTGQPPEDPRLSASMPGRWDEEEDVLTMWCDLSYDISYHVEDPAAVSVWERDACVGGMLNAISTFWQDTSLEALLEMTEEDVTAQFNLWAEASSTENVRINPVTVDDIHFEHNDERPAD